MSPINRESEGIILDTLDHGESDLIVTLYCRHGGRSSAIAKGAKKSKRRFVNKLELFTFIHVRLKQRNTRSLAILEEAELHSAFLPLRSHIIPYTAASVLREFCLLATREGEEDERIFTLLVWSLHHLSLPQPRLSHLQIVMLFLLRFYDYIGYRPDFSLCFHCGNDGQADSSSSFGFNTAHGGLICTSCKGSGFSSAIPLSTGTIKTLQLCQDTPLDKLHRLKVQDKSLYEALNVLHRFGKHILQRDIISWKMLRQTIKPQRPNWT
ncbi:DNA repair protein RecO [Desulfosediminicola sp.]|uniref:DNA repair protein RecO n=1 Tax=Desulfosediminicola sp. TaxID=2886825 RepID=UPI003AF22286